MDLIVYDFFHLILTNMFLPLLQSSSGWFNYVIIIMNQTL